MVWLAAAEVGCSAALTSGCPGRAHCTAAAQTQWQAGWPPGRRPKASVNGASEASKSGSLWLAQRGRSPGLDHGSDCRTSRATNGSPPRGQRQVPTASGRRSGPGSTGLRYFGLRLRLGAWRPTRRSVVVVVQTSVPDARVLQRPPCLGSVEPLLFPWRPWRRQWGR